MFDPTSKSKNMTFAIPFQERPNAKCKKVVAMDETCKNAKYLLIHAPKKVGIRHENVKPIFKPKNMTIDILF